MVIRNNKKNINQYLWLKENYSKIIKYYKNSSVHHSILLHSKIGTGEELLLYSISTWLMCSKKKNEIACNNCKNCQLMLKNNHPNFYKLSIGENKKNIGIEDIRIIIDDIFNNLSKQVRSVIWISNIELISEKIASSLLSILEEPPNNTFILLNCYNLHLVLFMIKSRCLIWDIHTCIKKSNINYINNYNEYVELKTAVNLFDGSLSIANEILKSKLWKVRFQLCQSISLAIKKKIYF